MTKHKQTRTLYEVCDPRSAPRLGEISSNVTDTLQDRLWGDLLPPIRHALEVPLENYLGGET